MISYLISRSITSNMLYDVVKITTYIEENGVENTEEVLVMKSNLDFESAAALVEELKKENE